MARSNPGNNRRSRRRAYAEDFQRLRRAAIRAAQDARPGENTQPFVQLDRLANRMQHRYGQVLINDLALQVARAAQYLADLLGTDRAQLAGQYAAGFADPALRPLVQAAASGQPLPEPGQQATVDTATALAVAHVTLSLSILAVQKGRPLPFPPSAQQAGQPDAADDPRLCLDQARVGTGTGAETGFWGHAEQELAGPVQMRPTSARIWNYLLGGKDYFPIDKYAAEQARMLCPYLPGIARAGRVFGARAVRHLAGERGIDQFIEVGPGMPLYDHTHQIAQRLDPQARTLYIDADAQVFAHARALLTDTTPQGVRQHLTRHLQAALHDTDRILAQAATALDLTRPVALILVAVVDHLVDDQEAYAAVGRLVDALAPGSYLVLSHLTDQFHAATGQAVRQLAEVGGPRLTPRTRQQILPLFTGLNLLDPGLVPVTQWRPEHGPWGEPEPLDALCAVGQIHPQHPSRRPIKHDRGPDRLVEREESAGGRTDGGAVRDPPGGPRQSTRRSADASCQRL